MSLSARERIQLFYAQFASDDQVLIPINADPDAIASAMAVKRLLWRKTAGVTIASVNVIKRPDNLAMIRLLKVNLQHVREIDPTDYNRIVMVDSQPNHHPWFEPLSPHVVIDHHPDTDCQAPYTDIRPRYGATATILTEYLKAAKIKPAAKLATGLFWAIKTDTSNFERQTLMEDLRAFQFLFRHANTALARRIEQTELRVDFLKYFKRAIEQRRSHKGRLFVHLGPVNSPDVCVLIADFFMRIESVAWSVVAGLCDRKLVVIFRNDGLRRNAGTVAKEAFGSLGSAGGHKSAARAEIPQAELKDIVDLKDDGKVQRWLIQQVEKRAGKASRGKVSSRGGSR
jgi:nanoRNase/pAp phosphatase (c-di-AMP/oligoRNAs hydrolase)